MKFFTNCTTLEELKAEYKRLAIKHHPDMGGNLETMQAINAEYDDIFPLLKNKHKTAEGKAYEKENDEAPETFKNMIEALLHMDGVKIEVIGCFIWLSGNTKPHKEEIKALGFKWSKNKSMWYKSPGGYRRRGKKDYDINSIRDMYGVQYAAEGHGATQLTA